MSTLEASVRLEGAANAAPAEVLALAERIANAQQCPVQLRLEARGFHLYIPCPACLDTHGKDEIHDPKYSINLSKACGLGEYGVTKGFNPAFAMDQAERADRMTEDGSICMRTWQSKTPHRYKLSELLQLGSVTSRHPDILVRASVAGRNIQADREALWEVDPVSGQKAPPPPGEVIPVTALPPLHPAAMYLRTRGFDLARLEKQFRCGFCVRENKKLKYPVLVDGWHDTPQGRIIFYGLRDGVPLTWQGRYLEMTADTSRILWHPYREQWVTVATRSHPGSPWIWVSPYDAVNDRGKRRFSLSKYKTGIASERGLMGWDAAIQRAKEDPCDMKWVVLCEGPLDAARVGPGGIALMGAALSHAHADLLSRHFDVVFTAFDNDRVGQDVTGRIKSILMNDRLLATRIQRVLFLPVTGGKDLGDMSQLEFDTMFHHALRRALH